MSFGGPVEFYLEVFNFPVNQMNMVQNKPHASKRYSAQKENYLKAARTLNNLY